MLVVLQNDRSRANARLLCMPGSTAAFPAMLPLPVETPLPYATRRAGVVLVATRLALVARRCAIAGRRVRIVPTCGSRAEYASYAIAAPTLSAVPTSISWKARVNSATSIFSTSVLRCLNSIRTPVLMSTPSRHPLTRSAKLVGLRP